MKPTKTDKETFYKDATPEKLARALFRPVNQSNAQPKPKRKRRQKSTAASAKRV